jgi:hypothetical protein
MNINLMGLLPACLKHSGGCHVRGTKATQSVLFLKEANQNPYFQVVRCSNEAGTFIEKAEVETALIFYHPSQGHNVQSFRSMTNHTTSTLISKGARTNIPKAVECHYFIVPLSLKRK